MKVSKLKSVNTNYNPLDLVEDIIIANNWEYERDSNNNIHVEVTGDWCDYQLSYGINEDHNLLYISCVLDINIPENRFKDIYSFLFSLNKEQKYVILVSFDGFRYDYDKRVDTPYFDYLNEWGDKAKSLKPVFLE